MKEVYSYAYVIRLEEAGLPDYLASLLSRGIRELGNRRKPSLSPPSSHGHSRRDCKLTCTSYGCQRILRAVVEI